MSAFKLSLIGPIFSFMFVDLFDSLGTLMSCSKEMGLIDDSGEVKNLGRMLYTDAGSTIIGATMGTSTVTAYVESAAGIMLGARTGLAATVTALGFLFITILYTTYQYSTWICNSTSFNCCRYIYV